MGTIDTHLLALDAKSGEILWNTTVASAEGALLDHDVAPDRKDKVIIGTRDGPHPRADRGLRRKDGQGAVALFHDSRTGPAGERHVVGHG